MMPLLFSLLIFLGQWSFSFSDPPKCTSAKFSYDCIFNNAEVVTFKLPFEILFGDYMILQNVDPKENLLDVGIAMYSSNKDVWRVAEKFSYHNKELTFDPVESYKDASIECEWARILITSVCSAENECMLRFGFNHDPRALPEFNEVELLLSRGNAAYVKYIDAIELGGRSNKMIRFQFVKNSTLPRSTPSPYDDVLNKWLFEKEGSNMLACKEGKSSTVTKITTTTTTTPAPKTTTTTTTKAPPLPPRPVTTTTTTTPAPKTTTSTTKAPPLPPRPRTTTTTTRLPPTSSSSHKPPGFNSSSTTDPLVPPLVSSSDKPFDVDSSSTTATIDPLVSPISSSSDKPAGSNSSATFTSTVDPHQESTTDELHPHPVDPTIHPENSSVDPSQGKSSNASKSNGEKDADDPEVAQAGGGFGFTDSQTWVVNDQGWIGSHANRNRILIFLFGNSVILAIFFGTVFALIYGKCLYGTVKQDESMILPPATMEKPPPLSKF